MGDLLEEFYLDMRLELETAREAWGRGDNEEGLSERITTLEKLFAEPTKETAKKGLTGDEEIDAWIDEQQIDGAVDDWKDVSLGGSRDHSKNQD